MPHRDTECCDLTVVHNFRVVRLLKICNSSVTFPHFSDFYECNYTFLYDLFVLIKISIVVPQESRTVGRVGGWVGVDFPFHLKWNDSVDRLLIL